MENEIKKEKQSKYFDLILALFVAVLLISNIASTKITSFWNFTLDAGTILFPLSYIFGDILTEVYGYRKSRRVIWIGFFCALLMSVIFMIVQYLPVAEGWENQAAYESILGFIPRIVIASLIAYLAGEFSNSIILSKLKIKMKGKMLWIRTISSTLVGQGVDTLIFCLIAFLGVFPTDMLIAIILSNYIFKCGVEILFTPITYNIVYFLKKEEGIDQYDYKTSYNPFALG
ncbi:queuosine precursor transporter [Candidatus Woesearchaeota archaeon]|nr:queuosine precursor transporter [Candidatus Woesearchaeota archaeon]